MHPTRPSKLDGIVVLLIGGNLGDRLDLIGRARRRCILLIGRALAQSAVYETAAWGTEDQASFLNQVLVLQSPYSTRAIMEHAQRIEGWLGRRHRRHWGEREQDIDILFHGERIIDKPDLRVPHPRMAERRFVLVPLAEVLPGWRHPESGHSAVDMLRMCPDELEATPLTQPGEQTLELGLN